jgi:hypothetical protein
VHHLSSVTFPVFHCPIKDLVSNQFSGGLILRRQCWRHGSLGGIGVQVGSTRYSCPQDRTLPQTFSSRLPPPNTQLTTAKTQAKKNMSSHEHQILKICMSGSSHCICTRLYLIGTRVSYNIILCLLGLVLASQHLLLHLVLLKDALHDQQTQAVSE